MGPPFSPPPPPKPNPCYYCWTLSTIALPLPLSYHHHLLSHHYCHSSTVQFTFLINDHAIKNQEIHRKWLHKRLKPYMNSSWQCYTEDVMITCLETITELSKIFHSSRLWLHLKERLFFCNITSDTKILLPLPPPPSKKKI